MNFVDTEHLHAPGSPRGRGSVMKSGRKLSICDLKKAINGTSRSRDDLPELNFVTFCDPLLPPG
ncbi:hypothetical protein DV515_00006643 [Chloebia gouldiae]|uniref:Uncharacterized protein n=1 Tax=Chloebia gouldiae TaxID=44316 RepID=A0A3L8SK17_CHLGU|nr:hypothetical protein DV515_00006643 [Chloebia gouldiae]